MLIRHRDRLEDGRVGMGRSSPVSIRPPGPLLRLAWKTTDAQYGWVRRKSRSGLHPIPHLHAKRGTRASPPTRPRDPHPTGGGASSPPHQSSRAPLALVVGTGAAESGNASFGCMSLGSPLNTPFASSSRSGSWTTPKLRSPEAADRWTWLVILAYVQLRLARPLVVDHRLPWQAPLPSEKLTPARVRRVFSHLLPMLSSDGVRTKTLWPLAWATQGTEIDPRTTISCGQIDRIISAKPRVARLSPTSF
jgi:hypothetical protein